MPPVDLALPELWEWDLRGGREGEGGRKKIREVSLHMLHKAKSLMYCV